MISYADITIKDYQYLLTLKEADDVISFLFKKSREEIDLLPIKEYNQLYIQVKKLKEPTVRNSKKLKIEGYDFAYLDVFNITLGEWLDASNYSKNNELTKLMAIFYRLFEKKKLDKPKLEKYDFDINYRSKIFEKVSCINYFQIKHDLEKLDKIIENNYSSIFDDEKKETVSKKVDKRTEAMFLHEQKIKQSYQKNAWKYTAYALANKDVTNLDEVYNTNLFKILNILVLEKDLELRNRKK